MVLLRKVDVELQLRLGIGSLDLGQKVLAAKSPVEAILRVLGMTTWQENGGPRRFMKTNGILIFILRGTRPIVQDCALLHLRPNGMTGHGDAAAAAAVGWRR